MLSKVRKFVEKHKYKILAGIGLLTAGYFAYNYMVDESEIKVSHLIKALQLNHVEEVVMKGNVIEFKSVGSEWYRTVVDQYTIQILLKLIKYFFHDKGTKTLFIQFKTL